jgi:pSer/pThr/pTyr-binding forkhead associated (FHA) protein
MARLTIQSSSGETKTQELTGDRISIGRHEDNTIVISDASVSGHHAEIIRDGGKWIVAL